MQFYKTEKWDFSNDSDCLITDEQWEQWDKEYAAYFETIKANLPKGFLKQYYQNHGFHDFSIKDIRIQNTKPDRIEVEIILEKGSQKILLIYKQISAYSISVPTNKMWIPFACMRWLTDEVYFREDRLWSHRIMCDGNCEIKLVFKKISIKKV